MTKIEKLAIKKDEFGRIAQIVEKLNEIIEEIEFMKKTKDIIVRSVK